MRVYDRWLWTSQNIGVNHSLIQTYPIDNHTWTAYRNTKPKVSSGSSLVPGWHQSETKKWRVTVHHDNTGYRDGERKEEWSYWPWLQSCGVRPGGGGLASSVLRSENPSGGRGGEMRWRGRSDFIGLQWLDGPTNDGPMYSGPMQKPSVNVSAETVCLVRPTIRLMKQVIFQTNKKNPLLPSFKTLE
jgi:hypothetical protein